MIAVDTNIIVRLLTRDDEQQYQRSRTLFEQQDIFISDRVILETEWVLRFAYRFAPNEICEALQNLLGLPNVQVTNANLVTQVIQWHEQGLDFADAFHLAQSQHCSAMYTFDSRFINRSQGLTECVVQQP